MAKIKKAQTGTTQYRSPYGKSKRTADSTVYFTNKARNYDYEKERGKVDSATDNVRRQPYKGTIGFDKNGRPLYPGADEYNPTTYKYIENVGMRINLPYINDREILNGPKDAKDIGKKAGSIKKKGGVITKAKTGKKIVKSSMKVVKSSSKMRTSKSKK
tara:strand:+ start:1339 stop:1815 length:477 start_codon:yes stop_codon:yes gene_type:complete